MIVNNLLNTDREPISAHTEEDKNCGMASVIQLKDGRWIVKYEPGVNRLDPKRTREYFGRGRLAKQNAEVRKQEIEYLSVARRSTSGPTFSECAVKYLTAKTPHCARRTIETLASRFATHIMPMIGNLGAAEISPLDIDHYVNERSRQTTCVWLGGKTGTVQTGKKVSQATINHEVTAIIGVLNWAVERQLILTHKLIKYRKPPLNYKIIEPPTPEEVQGILRHAPPHLIRVIFLSYYTGIRPGPVELFPMKWRQVNFTDMTITVISARKGGAVTRVIPVMDAAFGAALLAWWEADQLAGKAGESAIITFGGMPVKSVRKAWETAKKEAGIIRRIRLYDIRHAFATLLLSHNADLKSVSEMLGHSDTRITLSTYQHTSRSMHEQAIKLLPSLDAGSFDTDQGTTERIGITGKRK